MRAYLPAGNNCEVHWCLDLCSSSSLERLILVANDGKETLDGSGIDCYLRTDEFVTNVNLRHGRVLAKPQLPIEFLDALISTLNSFMNWRETLIRAVDEGKVKRNGNIAAIFIDGNGDVPGSSIIFDADSLEVGIVDTVGAGSTTNGDSGSNIGGVAHSNSLMSTRSEEALEGISNVSGALNNVGRAEESTEPSNLGPSKSLEPFLSWRNRRSNLVSNNILYRSDLNIVYLHDVRVDLRRRGANVINDRNFALITIIVAIEELLDEGIFNTTEHFLDRDVGDFGVLGGDGSLEDTDPLRILVKNCLDILGGPKRVLK